MMALCGDKLQGIETSIILIVFYHALKYINNETVEYMVKNCIVGKD